MAAAPLPDLRDLRTAAPPVSRGGIGFTQGRYGLRGNLELMLCDERDGLWVLWFNNDTAGTAAEPGGPPPGEWSGALRFATGRRYDQVHVVQSRNGPHHLEVLARSGGAPHRLRWSPEAAFTDEEPPPGAPARAVTVTETSDGTVWAGVLGEDGRARLLRADTTAYPRLAWSEVPPATPPPPEGHWTTTVLLPVRGTSRPGIGLLGPDDGVYLGPEGGIHPLPASRAAAGAAPDGVPRFYLWRGGSWLDVVHPGRPEADRRLPLPGTGDVTALAAAPLAEPGRTDLVLRRGGQLWHLRDHGHQEAPAAAEIVSRLTRTDGDEGKPVHRGG